MMDQTTMGVTPTLPKILGNRKGHVQRRRKQITFFEWSQPWNTLTEFLTYQLDVCMANLFWHSFYIFLAYILTFYLTLYLTFYLTFCLASTGMLSSIFFQAFILAFVPSCILTFSLNSLWHTLWHLAEVRQLTRRRARGRGGKGQLW